VTDFIELTLLIRSDAGGVHNTKKAVKFKNTKFQGKNYAKVIRRPCISTGVRTRTTLCRHTISLRRLK